MATLSSGRHSPRLELHPVRYEFSDRVGTGDDNWVMVEIHTSDGSQECSTRRATLLAHEVSELAHWMREHADGKGHAAR